MGIIFNIEEVLNMAVKIEDNGAAYYRKAASLKGKDNPKEATLLNELAETEEEHKQTFLGFLKDLPDLLQKNIEFDPYLDAQLYLNAMADAHGGEGAPSLANQLTGAETMADILKTAIRLEEKSIVFYLGIRDLVPENLGKEVVNTIIKEEKQHLVTLVKELRTIQKQ